MSNRRDVAERFTALWNEPDAARRSAAIRELWADDGVQVLVDPPVEIRDAARGLAFPVPTLDVRGHEALDARVSRAYEMFVAPGEHVFEATAEPVVLMPDVLAVRWSMVSKETGEPAGSGLDVLTLDADGRIRTDHQFIGGS
ncbi:hypothetical protein [Actinomadura oligospora]|uniref:hypothetical protein n=1 Tax=Actinomadura oligospora TaxID=111804 RepID=UPI00047E0A71|nr:hypothetical protein [Actinomadura oligospora]